MEELGAGANVLILILNFDAQNGEHEHLIPPVDTNKKFSKIDFALLLSDGQN